MQFKEVCRYVSIVLVAIVGVVGVVEVVAPVGLMDGAGLAYARRGVVARVDGEWGRGCGDAEGMRGASRGAVVGGPIL